MKNLTPLLLLLISFTLSAQKPEGMVRIDYKQAAQEAAEKTDEQLVPQLQEVRREVSSLKTQLLPKKDFYEVEIQCKNLYSNDELAFNVMKQFFFEVDKNPIAYVKRLQEFSGVFIIEKPKNFIAETKSRKILIGSYANNFPHTKKVIILHKLATFFGAESFGGFSYNVLNYNFVLNAKTEKIYSNPERENRNVDMKYIIKKLKECCPIKTRI